MIIAAFAGVAVALFRVADRRDAERTQQAQESTTAPSAGLDRQPTDGPAATPATTSATTAPADDEGPPVILKGDGIGAFLFGADPDQVLAGLTLRWGPPDGDSGWVAARSSPYGPCPGTVVRGVNWRGFTVLFSDGATPRGKAGTRHFFTWEYQVDDPDHPAPDKGGNRPGAHDRQRDLGRLDRLRRSSGPTGIGSNCSTSRPPAPSSACRLPRAASTARSPATTRGASSGPSSAAGAAGQTRPTSPGI